MKREAEFLKKVRELAAKNNMSATAKALKIPVYTLKARLLSATIKLGENPPQFAKKRASKKVSKAIKRIPQQIFQELNWNKGDNIVIRRSGKNKIIIEKSAN